MPPATQQVKASRMPPRIAPAPDPIPAPSTGLPPPAARCAPGIGAHTHAVLKDFGFAPEEIDALRAEGVIA
ncbi:MAG: hypothetical protein HC809_12080 [Gammaproteobacteria bacterium]|nr:hypothetical protein [Gammaproteobacteria bacterium]